jgi:hypothetical protein
VSRQSPVNRPALRTQQGCHSAQWCVRQRAIACGGTRPVPRNTHWEPFQTAPWARGGPGGPAAPATSGSHRPAWWVLHDIGRPFRCAVLVDPGAVRGRHCAWRRLGGGAPGKRSARRGGLLPLSGGDWTVLAGTSETPRGRARAWQRPLRRRIHFSALGGLGAGADRAGRGAARTTGRAHNARGHGRRCFFLQRQEYPPSPERRLCL